MIEPRKLGICLIPLLFFITLTQTSFAQSQEALDQAIRHLQLVKGDFHLNDTDINGYEVSDHYVTKHNGVNHIYLKQRYQGIDVYNGIININVLPNGEILNMGNRFIANIANRANTSNPSISAEAAVRKVIQNFQVPTKNDLRIKEQINANEFIFNKDGIALEDIKATLVFEALALKKVRLVWMVELYEFSAQNWWNARVDAVTGEIVNYHNQVIKCNFGTPDGQCHESHPHANLDINNLRTQTNTASFKNNNLANSYRVFAPPVESPNHGARTLETSPANPLASPFGWHDTNGATGPEFTITRGNNTHAYHDIFDLNSSLGDEPDGGATLDFDYALDLASQKPYQNIDPAVVNLFYWCNMMHDVWYEYGFDESAGNFQVNNYGNGGSQGDYVRAEALDGSGTNNANFSTAQDGSTARIQMYIWGTGGGGGVSRVLSVLSPAGIAGDYDYVPGGFGGDFATLNGTASVVFVDDGTAPNTDACESIINGADIAGNVAMIDRGDCEFGVKMLEAENNGAIAVIMCNNIPDAPIPMGAGAVGNQVTIPGLMISQADCATIRAQLPGVTIQLGSSLTIPNPGPTALDGDLDNGIVAHEYGHGISIRGTGGPGSGSCLSNAEQQGEGWSDYFSLVMTIEPGDVGVTGRGIGTYAQDQPVTGNGIRTYRYSTNTGINPHTYSSIGSEAIPHGVGSVWCAMLWDMTWDLIDVYGFDPDLYNGTGGNNIAMRLVMDGIKLQPCSPGFVDSRDAILAADMANNGGANQCLIWEAFARRGLGYTATQGSTNSTTDGTEGYDLPPSCSSVLFMTKTAAESVNAGGNLTYTIEVVNNTLGTLNNVVVTDNLPVGTTLVGGTTSCGGSASGNVLTIPLGNMAANTTMTCTYDVTAPVSPSSNAIFYDDMDSGNLNWTVSNGSGPADWSLTNTNPNSGSSAWFAEDLEEICDQYLILTNPITLTGASPTLAFWHEYQTEATWDGGVVEISTNGGNNWVDLGSSMIKNGYNGQITQNDDSPISLRDAFNGNSGGYIQTFVDLSSYSGQNAQIRFRLGCDGAVGAPGWWIDDVQFLDDYVTITNTACVSSDLNENVCASVTTYVEGTTTGIRNTEPVLGASLFPNPATELVNIIFDEPQTGMLNVRIINVDGKEMLNRSIENPNTQIELDVKDYAAGVYMVELRSDKGISTKKLIVQ